MTYSHTAATNPISSAWVSANAGAGKTYLLTDRVTRLLLAGSHPSRILCLTYTKAAASEMASRLFDRLGQWALLSDNALDERLIAIGADTIDPEMRARARRLFAQALETPGGLKIQTIHSFCQNVLARFPVEAGIPARFTVLDERSAAELMSEARNTALQRAAKGDERLANAVAVLATRAADGRFAEILDVAVNDSSKLRGLIAYHGDEARFFAHLRRTLQIADGETEAAVLERFCQELHADRAMCERVSAWLAASSPNDRKTGAQFARFLASELPAAKYEALRGIFFTTQNEPRKALLTKAASASAPALAEFVDRVKERVYAIEDHRRRAVTCALTEALITVALAVLDVYDGLKRSRAVLDYDDLTRHTLDLLDRRDAASWVLYKLDGGIEHILVDEAQDTSPEQWRIVAKLTDEFFAGRGVREYVRPRTIFAVGDEKQSIFSFQGADPLEFGRHRKLFQTRALGAELPFADLRPQISRRSARSVLEFVDEVFAAADARDGLTSTTDPIHHDPHRAEIGRVEIWPGVKPPKTEERDPWEQAVDAPSRSSAQVVLAARIASRIAEWIRSGTRLPGSIKPIAPGDIMILVRRRNAFAEEMIRQLIDKRVPVAGADRMVLMDQIAIADLVALGRFVLLPEDDLNLAALLRSPLIGFSEDDVYDLAQPRPGRLWDELRVRQDERAIFQRANVFLTGVLAEADYLPPFEFYARALGKGLRKRLIARLGAEAADAIDEFLALALAHESSHPPSLESFLNWFVKGASEVKRDMEQGGGAVRVMTVHGAKGLEADVVILPDTLQVPDHERRGPLLYADNCVFFGVPKALESAAITAAKAAAQRREMREYRRLLYVAATRAREFLVICGYENKIASSATPWYRHLCEAGKRIGREEESVGEKIIVMGAALLSGAPLGGSEESQAAVLPEYFAHAAALEPASRLLRPSEAAGLEELPAISPLADSGKRFQRGLLVHALLARLPDVAPKDREAAGLSYLQRRGLAGAEAKPLLTETLAILEHPAFAPLFGPHSRAEVALIAELPELGHSRVSGQIDRLAVTDEAVLIADFKTNRPAPSSVEETPRIYRTQMALYRAGLQKIYPGKRIECALVWTDGARLMPLPSSLLDAEIAKIAAA